MADLEQALKITLLNEDGKDSKWFYTLQDPGDPGGETVHGIARNPWPNWLGWPLVDASKKLEGFPRVMLAMDSINTLVHSFYQDNFWNKMKGDMMNAQVIANQVFDSAVNQGSGAAGKLLQEAVNWVDNCLKVDGNIGPVTIKALNRICFSTGGSEKILARFLELRRAKYQALASARPAEAHFLKLWLARCEVA